MKPKTFGLLAVLIALLSILPGANAQQATTAQTATFRVLELPSNFRNSASFVEWAYQPTDDTLRVGNQPNGVLLLGKRWHEGANMWLPLGLNQQGQFNLQVNPCHSGTTSVLGEAYNDMIGFVLVDESVLNESFTLSIYTDDSNNQGAGAKLTLNASNFAQARSVDMLAIPAPAASFGKVSGITSSLPDQYNLLVENVGGFWLGMNGPPARGVGLNQGERFTSAQVPPCQPAGPEFANDLGDSILLLPRETACAPGRVTLHENDLDGRPSGKSWPITLSPSLCASQTTYEVSADIPLAPEFCGETADISGHIAIQASAAPPAGAYSLTLQRSVYPLTFSNEFVAGTPVTVTVTTGPNAIPWSLHRDQTELISGTLTIVGASTGPCRPRDEDEGTTLYLPLVAGPTPDRAGDDDPCDAASVIMTVNDRAVRTWPITSDTVLAAPRMPLNTNVVFSVQGIPGQLIMDQPYHAVGNNTLTTNFAPSTAGDPFVLHWTSECGDGQASGTIDP